ncbi:MAG: hypothetical protein PVG79_09760 [Gemmatimonadales bacterium]|jgi:hypothetical protein
MAERAITSLPLLGLLSCGSPEASIPSAPWGSVESVVLGSPIADDIMLTWVPLGRMDGVGRFYAIEPQEACVIVIERDGAVLTTVGRSGEGPGEFIMPSRVGFGADEFWVRDRQRFSFFDYSGRLRRTVTPPVASIDYQGFPVRLEALLSDSVFIGRPQIPADVRIGEHIEYEPLLKVTAPGIGGKARMDTIAWTYIGTQTLTVRNPRRSSVGGLYGPQPFSDSDLYKIMPERGEVVIVRRQEAGVVSFVRIAANGDTLAVRRLQYERRRVGPEMVEREIERLTRVAMKFPALGAPSYSEGREWVADALYVPEYLPAVAEMRVGGDGTLWLRKSDSGEPTVPQVWDAFDGWSGVHIRSVELPREFRVLAVSGDDVWGVRTDSLDVPYLVLRRLVRSPARSME